MANITFTNAEGATIDLHDGVNHTVLTGIRGLGAPQYGVVAEEVPQQPGTRIQRIQVKERLVDLPVVIEDSSVPNLQARLRSLAGVLDPNLGNGVLSVDRNGVQRDLICRCIEPPDPNELPEATWFKEVLVFYAETPFFYDISEQTQQFSLGAAGSFFPIFPITLTLDTIFSDGLVHNPGDVEAWPVWTVIGPGQDLLLRNPDTGKSLSLSGLTLSAGEVVTIDTRPGKKTVTKQDDTNLFRYVSGSLWPLKKGNNSVNIEFGGADGNSLVGLAFTPRYNTA